MCMSIALTEKSYEHMYAVLVPLKKDAHFPNLFLFFIHFFSFTLDGKLKLDCAAQTGLNNPVIQTVSESRLERFEVCMLLSITKKTLFAG